MVLKADIALLSRNARSGLIDVEGAAEVLGVDRSRASRRLTDLMGAGWLSRVKRGLYYVRPLEALPDRPAVPEDPWVVGSVLYGPCYIGGWSAAEHWDLTEQIFRETFIVTARAVRATQTTVLGLRFRLVRVGSPKRIEDADLVWRGSERVHVSGPERTIVDGLNDPSWLGGWRHLNDVLRTYMEDKPDGGRLQLEMLKHARGAAFKRLGFVLERLFPREEALIEVAASRSTKGVVKLDPYLARKGRLDKRWGLWINTPLASGQ